MVCFIWHLMKRNMLPFCKYWFVICLLIPWNLLQSVIAQPKLSKKHFRKAIERFVGDDLLNNASVSMQFTFLKTNTKLAAVDENRALIPGSIIKLIPCKFMLDTMGELYTYKTPFYLRAHPSANGLNDYSVWVKGSGDPSFCSLKFGLPISLDSLSRNLADALKKENVYALERGIEINEDWMEDLPENPEWLYYDLGNYYGGGCRALNFQENEFDVVIYPAASEGNICPIKWNNWDYHPDAFLSKIVGVRGDPTGEIFVLGSSRESNRKIFGEWKIQSNDSTRIRVSMNQPFREFQIGLSRLLSQLGIRMAEDSVYNRMSIDSKYSQRLILEVVSPPAQELVKRALEKSVNLYCESFLYKLTERWTKGTQREHGLNILENYLAQQLGNDLTLDMKDGSGLSPKNLISASTMCKFLSGNQKTASQNYYFHYLSDIHTTGSLKKYLKPKKNVNRFIYAKTGSMERVRAFAGYLVEDNVPVVAFVIMVNNFQCKGSALQERFAVLFDHLMDVKLEK